MSVYSHSKAKEQHVILIFNFIPVCKKNKLADRFVQKTFSMNNRLLSNLYVVSLEDSILCSGKVGCVELRSIKLPQTFEN